MIKFTSAAAAAIVLVGAASASVALEYDQNVTPEYINGTGTINGSFTVDRQNGVELGLRAKVRYNAMNMPENTFLSNGDGTYGPFPTGGPTAPPGAVTRARWNFEWTINTNYDGSSGLVLSDLTYVLSMDGEPSCANIPLEWDPVTPGANEAPLYFLCYDHSMGDNSTPNSGGIEVACANPGSDVAYQANLDTYNVLQQSWNYRFYPPGPGFTFDQNADATYDISLTALDGDGNVVASTAIKVIVGTGGEADSDLDGVCDGDDLCPDSNIAPTVVLGDCDTGVPNRVNADGCTISDLLEACDDAGEDNRGGYVRCIASLAGDLRATGLITGRERGALMSCAGKSR